MDPNEVLSKMKPEHAAIIEDVINKAKEDLKKAQEDLATATAERDAATEDRDKAKEELDTANEDLATAKSELETLKADMPCECDGEADEKGNCKVCGKPKKAKTGAAFDESETLKSMPQEVREVFEKMKAQKEAAEEEIRKAKDAEATAQAVAKAKELKSIPIEESKLAAIIKKADTDVLDLLSVVNAAIAGTVLGEVGKSQQNATGGDAWAKIEAKADEIVKRDSVTKAKAISVVIKEEPDLYKEYLQGGAN